jgi:hypothetical protein
MAARLAIA